MATHNESDSAWKDILDAYFKEFVEFCLPELYELIDWQQSWVSLDKELQVITKGAEAGKRLLDKLFKVFLKDGQEQWVLIHVEVQGRKDNTFSKRMFVYGYRVYDKYQMPIVSCAILTDGSPNWRPAHFQVGLVGSYLSAKYLVVKIIDYRSRLDELDASMNPFASVILIQLLALNSKRKSGKERKQIKFALTKRLYTKGYSKMGVVNLYRFIDWLIELPAPLDLEYTNEIHELEEVKKMPYISFAERHFMEKGLQQGIQQGVQQGVQQGIQQGLERGLQRGEEQGLEKAARNMLAEGMQLSLIERITGFSKSKIEKLKQILQVVPETT